MYGQYIYEISRALAYSNKYVDTLGCPLLTTDDLIMVGCEAGLKALEKYDPNLGRIKAHLYSRIRYGILEEIRKQLRKYKSVSFNIEISVDYGLPVIAPSVPIRWEVLREKERWILQEHYYNKRTLTEIAKELKVCAGTIAVTKNRALEKLRRVMKKAPDFSSEIRLAFVREAVNK
jgi:DNA-directed RNA polymerase specialized sigma subunit